MEIKKILGCSRDEMWVLGGGLRDMRCEKAVLRSGSSTPQETQGKAKGRAFVAPGPSSRNESAAYAS